MGTREAIREFLKSRELFISERATSKIKALARARHHRLAFSKSPGSETSCRSFGGFHHDEPFAFECSTRRRTQHARRMRNAAGITDPGYNQSPITRYQGLGAGVGRGLGVGADRGVAVGLAVAVGVGVGVAVAVAVGLAVGVGVGVAAPARG